MIRIRGILGVPSYALTCITGFLVLYSGGNKYPNRFIGAICLCQAISTYVLYQMDYDYCKDQIALKIFRNSLLTKDSELSKYLGFYFTTLSDLELAGIQIVMYTFWYHIAQYCELLMTIFLHIDVVTTIKNPFNRSKTLRKLKKISILGCIVILLICISSIIYGVVLINNNDSLRDDGFVNTFDNPDYVFNHLLSIDFVINIFYNKFSGFIWVGYTFIGIYALTACLWGYITNISCSKKTS